MKKRDDFTPMMVGRLLKDKRFHGQMVLLFLVSLLMTFSIVFVFSMSDGITEKYTILGGGDLLAQGVVDGGDVVRTTGALCYGKENTLSVMAKGVDASYFSPLRKKQFLSFSEGEAESTLPKVIISKVLQQKLQLSTGDKTLIVLVKGESYAPVLCVVDGFYETGYREMDSALIFMESKTLEKYGIAAQTEIMTKQEASLRAKLKDEGIESQPWWERNDDIAQNLVVSKQVIMGIFLIIVIIAAYFVSDFSATLVSDKKKEIALLRLLGQKDRKIEGVFLETTFLLSLFSLISGLAGGIVLSYVAKPFLRMLAGADISALSYYLLSFDIVIPFKAILLLFTCLLLFCLFSTMVVLRRIKRIDPLVLAQ